MLRNKLSEQVVEVVGVQMFFEQSKSMVDL